MMAATNDSYIAVSPLAVGDVTFYMTIEKQWRCQLLPCVKDPVSDVIQWSKLERGRRKVIIRYCIVLLVMKRQGCKMFCSIA